MTDLVMFLIITASITEILSQSTLVKPVRDWIGKHSRFIYKLISCPMCLGFWVGCVVVLLSLTSSTPQTHPSGAWGVLCYGFMGSLSATLYHSILVALGADAHGKHQSQ